MHKGKLHPATLPFQGIRIEVNDELGVLERLFNSLEEAKLSNCIVAIISFHSLEDRPVKRFLREQSKGDHFPPDMPVTADMLSPQIKLIGRAIHATEKEVKYNRRSRSAVMRVAEKIDRKEGEND